ncbi:hypothetical protein, partial [Salmonella sp. ZJHZ19_0081]|uniref:hypothetical protein n=1 Tax=Salmonella sp. ZJHZ19_0081 TaxID=3159587 RepID=UPI0039793064
LTLNLVGVDVEVWAKQMVRDCRLWEGVGFDDADAVDVRDAAHCEVVDTTTTSELNVHQFLVLQQDAEPRWVDQSHQTAKVSIAADERFDDF